MNNLTKREQEVIKLLAQAMRRNTIAQKLQISIFTLDKHLNHIYKKTGTKSGCELLLWILKNKN